MARKTPAGYLAAINRILSAWERLRPDMSFGGMTLEQFKAAVQPSFNKRAAIAEARVLLQTQIRERGTDDQRSWKLSRRVVNSVLGTPGEGEDGLLYAAGLRPLVGETWKGKSEAKSQGRFARRSARVVSTSRSSGRSCWRAFSANC